MVRGRGSDPASSTRLGALIAPQHLSWGNLRGLTVDRIDSLLWSTGSAQSQVALFQTIMQRAGYIGGLIGQRVQDLTNATWRFAPVEKVKDPATGKVTIPADVQKVIDALPSQAKLQAAVSHLAHAKLFGFAAAQKVLGDDGVSVVDLEPIPYMAVEWREGTWSLYLEGRQVEVDDELRARLCIVTADPTDPLSPAVMRPVAVLWKLKAKLLAAWDLYVERFGDPTTLGTFDPEVLITEEGISAEQTVLNVLKEVGQTPRVAIPNGIVVSYLTDPRTAEDLFDTYRRAINEELSVTIVGTASTTTQGKDGARAADEVRERTADAIIEGDSQLLCNTLQRELVDPLELALTGSTGKVKVVRSWEKEVPPKERADTISVLKTAGVDFNPDPIREEFGLEPPTPEQIEEKRAQAAALATGRGGEVGGEPGPFERDTREARAGASTQAETPAPALHRAAPGTTGQALDSIAVLASAQASLWVRDTLLPAIADALPEDATPEEADAILRGLFLESTLLEPLAQTLEASILAARLNALATSKAELNRLKARHEVATP